MTTSAPPTPNQTTDLMEQLRGGLQGFSERWLVRADELEDFLDRWLTAWNTHNIDGAQEPGDRGHRL